MKISLKTLGICLGIFFVCLYGLLSIICWRSGLSAYHDFLTYSTYVPVMCLVFALVCWYWRQKNGPYLPFLSALQFFFIAYVIFEVGYALVTFLLYDVFDKTLYYRVLEFSLTQRKALYIQQHLPTVQIDDALESNRKNMQEGVTAMQLILGFGQSLLLDFVKSLLLAIALQKKPPVESVSPIGKAS